MTETRETRIEKAERKAWEKFAAAAIASDIHNSTDTRAKAADSMLLEWKKRFIK